ncbi:hypothetical protein [Amycolatopsis sp. H20-H5]|uniref:hypothetical protein n=1 Tax=Amycolatopsis sp. H20-H5 TaxID=3046309 RepID=UPI002DB872DA|nr:hypothetical protein [Amycolatopsis sp. H20-H5]MEC3973837.1 hypothetical protein [Amycolatopsis sp. H20-H5]
MNGVPPRWVPETLSGPRFARYLQAAEGDTDLAIRLYQWNLDASSAFYHLLHWIEVSWRNAMDRQLRHRFARADWWSTAQLDPNGADKVRRAQGQLDRRKPGGTADDLMTEFTFGFWVSLLSRGRAYDRTLWVPGLHRAFPNYSGPRAPLHREVYPVLHFRNRIMHYEPIVDLDLEWYREQIYRLLGYVSADVVKLVRELDRIPEVLDRRPLPRCRGGEQA